MVSKRPGNSRDDKSGKSSNRPQKADEKPKKATSSRGNFSTGNKSKDNNSRPAKKFGDDRARSKTSYASTDKSGQKRQDGGKLAGRTDGYNSNKGNADKRPSSRTGRNETDSRRSFQPRNKPYEGRPVADKSKSDFGGRAPGKGKPFSSRDRSTPASFGGEGPKRSSGSYRGESDKTGDRKFPARPTAGRGFKKSDDRPDRTEKPERSKLIYDKITRDQDAPVKTLRGRKKGAEAKDSGLIRLNRYISNAGICSRRKADDLISAGVVSVNGVVVSELGYKVDPQKDEVRYNGETLKREKMVYVLLNKPKDYITTTDDPQERRTVMHLVEKASRERIYPIGRLDRNTTGLLLMTNDGDLADKLSHPRNNIVKLYQVELSKSLTQGDLNKIAFGVELEDGLIKPDFISYVAGGSKREVGIQIHSGKNRIVRRIFEHLGYEVVKLDRTVYANLTKKDLPRGRWRYLDESEVIMLKHLV